MSATREFTLNDAWGGGGVNVSWSADTVVRRYQEQNETARRGWGRRTNATTQPQMHSPAQHSTPGICSESERIRATPLHCTRNTNNTQKRRLLPSGPCCPYQRLDSPRLDKTYTLERNLGIPSRAIDSSTAPGSITSHGARGKGSHSGENEIRQNRY